ncbi:MAG: undecaprenyl-diphosphate phosphatase [Coriobacteriia bacterium]|nr:undecaprenyl-diphosphate phosphatase [Coriobacteriia bacterium]
MTSVFVIAEWVYALTLSVVQGITEFIPVSSSGHLSLLTLLFGRDPHAGIDFTFFLHIATLIAAVLYFRDDIKDMLRSWLPQHAHDMKAQRRISVFLLVSCLITGPMGLLFADSLGYLAANLLVLGAMFILTAISLLATEYVLAHASYLRKMENLSVPRAIFIGFVQGLAVIPGLSRSGATIAAGVWMGLSRPQSARYSFLLSIPIILAGTLRDCLRLYQGTIALPPFWISLVSFIVAGVVGYLAIAWMIRLVSRSTLNYFALYTALMGIVLVVLHFIGR